MLVTQARQPAARRSAFTLLEVLVVVAILVILASVGTVSVLRYLDDARVDTAVLQMQMLQKSCKAYYLKSTAWPSDSMQELAFPPDGGRPLIDGGESALTDPWGNRYQMSLQPNPSSGEEEPVVYTKTPNNQMISWPKR